MVLEYLLATDFLAVVSLDKSLAHRIGADSRAWFRRHRGFIANLLKALLLFSNTVDNIPKNIMINFIKLSCHFIHAMRSFKLRNNTIRNSFVRTISPWATSGATAVQGVKEIYSNTGKALASSISIVVFHLARVY